MPRELMPTNSARNVHRTRNVDRHADLQRNGVGQRNQSRGSQHPGTQGGRNNASGNGGGQNTQDERKARRKERYRRRRKARREREERRKVEIEERLGVLEAELRAVRANTIPPPHIQQSPESPQSQVQQRQSPQSPQMAISQLPQQYQEQTLSPKEQSSQADPSRSEVELEEVLEQKLETMYQRLLTSHSTIDQAQAERRLTEAHSSPNMNQGNETGITSKNSPLTNALFQSNLLRTQLWALMDRQDDSDFSTQLEVLKKVMYATYNSIDDDGLSQHMGNILCEFLMHLHVRLFEIKRSVAEVLGVTIDHYNQHLQTAQSREDIKSAEDKLVELITNQSKMGFLRGKIALMHYLRRLYLPLYSKNRPDKSKRALGRRCIPIDNAVARMLGISDGDLEKSRSNPIEIRRYSEMSIPSVLQSQSSPTIVLHENGDISWSTPED